VDVVALLVLGLGILEVDPNMFLDLFELVDNFVGGWVGRGFLAAGKGDLERTTGVVSIIGKEGGDLGGGVLGVVVCELGEG